MKSIDHSSRRKNYKLDVDSACRCNKYQDCLVSMCGTMRGHSKIGRPLPYSEISIPTLVYCDPLAIPFLFSNQTTQRSGYFMKNIRLLSIILPLAMLQACGGGGDDKAPSTGSAGSSTELNSSVTSASTATATATVPVVDSASSGFVAKSQIGLALQNGLYAVSYGAELLDGKPDKSIFRTTIETTTDGIKELKTENYAGNTENGNGPLGQAHWEIYGPKTPYGSTLTQIRLDDDNGRIVTLHDMGSNEIKSYAWNAEVTPVDLTGSSIQQFLINHRSRTPPDKKLSIEGVFPTGSQGFNISYVFDEDRFLADGQGGLIYSQADFEKSTRCTWWKSSDQLGYRVMPNGVLSIYEIQYTLGCEDALKTGKFIGNGSWNRKQSSGIDYIEIAFPENIPYSRFDNSFFEQEYVRGIRAARVISPTGPWPLVHFIPAGTKFQSTSMALNAQAANAIKAAAPM